MVSSWKGGQRAARGGGDTYLDRVVDAQEWERADVGGEVELSRNSHVKRGPGASLPTRRLQLQKSHSRD